MSFTSISTFFCRLLAQVANQSITWQQVNAFRYVDVVRTTCLSSKSASELGRNEETLSVANMVVAARRAVGLSASQTAAESAVLFCFLAGEFYSPMACG